jgi:hypothetical protein
LKNKEAERMYRMIFDKKTQNITEIGVVLLQQHNINPNTIMIKTAQDYEEKFKDKDVAMLHFLHYQRRRQKILLKLANYREEKAKGHSSSMI